MRHTCIQYIVQCIFIECVSFLYRYHCNNQKISQHHSTHSLRDLLALTSLRDLLALTMLAMCYHTMVPVNIGAGYSTPGDWLECCEVSLMLHLLRGENLLSISNWSDITIRGGCLVFLIYAPIIL